MSVGKGVPEGEIITSVVFTLLVMLECKGEAIFKVVGAMETLVCEAEACGPRVTGSDGWGKDTEHAGACLEWTDCDWRAEELPGWCVIDWVEAASELPLGLFGSLSPDKSR